MVYLVYTLFNEIFLDSAKDFNNFNSFQIAQMVGEPLENTAEVTGSGDGPVATRSDEDKVVRIIYNRTHMKVSTRPDERVLLILFETLLESA